MSSSSASRSTPTLPTSRANSPPSVPIVPPHDCRRHRPGDRRGRPAMRSTAPARSSRPAALVRRRRSDQAGDRRAVRTRDALRAVDSQRDSRTGGAARGLTGPLAGAQSPAGVHPGRGSRAREPARVSAPGIWLEDEQGRWVAMLARRASRDAWDAVRRGAPGTSRPQWRETGPWCGRALSARPASQSRHWPSCLVSSRGDVNGLPLAYLPGPDGVDLRLTARGLAPAGRGQALSSAVGTTPRASRPLGVRRRHDDLAAVVLDALPRAGIYTSPSARAARAGCSAPVSQRCPGRATCSSAA